MMVKTPKICHLDPLLIDSNVMFLLGHGKLFFIYQIVFRT